MGGKKKEIKQKMRKKKKKEKAKKKNKIAQRGVRKGGIR